MCSKLEGPMTDAMLLHLFFMLPDNFPAFQMDPTGVASAVSAALASTVKLTEKVFEIRAVDEQASNLLETIDQVNGQLDVARELRRQKSGALRESEKKMMDTTFANTERALSYVAKLVEPCRVSMETKKGGVGLGTRIMFVIRDSSNIQISLTRLGLASQSLQTTLTLLYSRDSAEDPRTESMTGESKKPPSYAESQFLTASRMRNMLRRASRSIESDNPQDYDTKSSGMPLAGVPEDLVCVREPSEPFPTGLRDRSYSQNELFFDTNDGSGPGSLCKQPCRYLPYRPVSPSSSVSSLRSTLSLPTVLQPGWSPPLTCAVFAPGDQIEGHRGTYHDANERGSYFTGWNASPTQWARALPRPASTPGSVSWSDSLIPQISPTHGRQQPVAELDDTSRGGTSIGPTGTSYMQDIAELADTSATFLTKTFAIPWSTSDNDSRPLFSKLLKLEDKPLPEAIHDAQLIDASIAVQSEAPDTALISFESTELCSSPETSAPTVSLAPTPLDLLSDSEPGKVEDSVGLVLIGKDSTSLSLELPVGVLETARQRRFKQACEVHRSVLPQSRASRRREKMLLDVGLQGSPPLPVRTDMPVPPVPTRQAPQPPPPSPPRHDVPAVAEPDSKSHPEVSSPRTMSKVPTTPEPLSGRARSQRWREAQLERSERLQEKH